MMNTNIYKLGLFQKIPIGYIFTLICVFIWGMTFISTKQLLADFSPVEILIFRFLIAYISLWILSPKILRVKNWKIELLFALCGLSGVTLYQWLENIALTYSQASNVSVIISVAPIFTAIAAHFFIKNERKLVLRFFIGLIASLLGVALLSFSDFSQVHLNPKGDFLALASAFSWTFYSLGIKKINEQNYPSILATRRIFFYALIFMIPITIFSGINTDFQTNIIRFSKFSNLFNLIFLGVGASACCFLIWNKAIHSLGGIKTTVFIYLIPVVTVIGSFFILHEKLTFIATIGVIVTLTGLFISEDIFHKSKIKDKNESDNFSDKP